MTRRKLELSWPGAIGALGHVLLCASALLLSSFASSVSAGETQATSLETFQKKEDLLYRTGFRLSRSNAEFCSRRENSLGILIHDARAYSNPDAVRSIFNLSGDIGVQSVAEGSPAEGAGLAQNDTLIAVNGVLLADLPVKTKDDWTRATAIGSLLKGSTARSSVSVSWITGSGEFVSANIEPLPVCLSSFELLSGNDNAAADGTRVLVGEKLPAFDYPIDEFAAVLAHEMAHNILGHLEMRKTKEKRGSIVRQTEREADRLMPWLLANAGYDPTAAVRMMERWGPQHAGGLFRRRTHDGWDERKDIIQAEVSLIQKSRTMRPDRSADWLTQFNLELAR